MLMQEQQASYWNLPERLPCLECAGRSDATASTVTSPHLVQYNSWYMKSGQCAVTCCVCTAAT